MLLRARADALIKQCLDRGAGAEHEALHQPKTADHILAVLNAMYSRNLENVIDESGEAVYAALDPEAVSLHDTAELDIWRAEPAIVALAINAAVELTGAVCRPI